MQLVVANLRVEPRRAEHEGDGEVLVGALLPREAPRDLGGVRVEQEG